MSHRAASSGLSGEENRIQCGTGAVRWHRFSFHPNMAASDTSRATIGHCQFTTGPYT